MLYPLSYEGGRPRRRPGPARSDTDISIQGEGTYYALGMAAAADRCASPRRRLPPRVASTRYYVGALAKLSVLQYFVAEAAVIGAWAGAATLQPPDRVHQRPGCRGLRGLRGPGRLFAAAPADERLVCGPGPGHDGRGRCCSARPCCVRRRSRATGRPRGLAGGRRGSPRSPRGSSPAWPVRGPWWWGWCPRTPGSAWHLRGRRHVLRRRGRARCCCWAACGSGRRRWAGSILACGRCPSVALVAGGVTGMEVPEPGTLERLMGYPITIGMAAVGLVVAQRVRQERAAVSAGRAGEPARHRTSRAAEAAWRAGGPQAAYLPVAAGDGAAAAVAVAMIFSSSSSGSFNQGDSPAPCSAASGLSVWVHHLASKTRPSKSTRSPLRRWWPAATAGAVTAGAVSCGAGLSPGSTGPMMRHGVVAALEYRIVGGVSAGPPFGLVDVGVPARSAPRRCRWCLPTTPGTGWWTDRP